MEYLRLPYRNDAKSLFLRPPYYILVIERRFGYKIIDQNVAERSQKLHHSYEATSMPSLVINYEWSFILFKLDVKI